jgi:hypothetical protein
VGAEGQSGRTLVFSLPDSRDTGDNCSSVSLSPAINENLQQGLIAGVVDTGDKHHSRMKIGALGEGV